MQLETVGEFVRILRSRRGLEQVELARACGWRDASAVSRIETDRIKPTRRTLIKLADALADPSVPGDGDRIQAWMFLASGIQPTSDDAERASDSWAPALGGPLPAFVRDFAWSVWDANPQALEELRLPPRFRGRNHVELVLGDPSRHRDAHGAPDPRVLQLIRAFRADTAPRQDQRWYRRLRDQLERLPGFRLSWDGADPEAVGPLYGWGPSPSETYQAVAHRVRRDPRFLVVTLVPHDMATLESILKASATG